MWEWVNRVEKIVGKGDNVGYQHFLILPQRLRKLLLLCRENRGLISKEVNEFLQQRFTSLPN